MTSPAAAFRISRTSQTLGMRPPVPLPPVHGSPVRPGGASLPRVLLALRDLGTRVLQVIPCSVTEERLENDVGSPFISFNALVGHRPLSRAYPMSKSGTHGSQWRRNTDVLPTSVPFHRWRLGFKQSSLRLIAQALQDHSLHIFRCLPLYQHALVPSPFRVQVSCSPRSHQP